MLTSGTLHSSSRNCRRYNVFSTFLSGSLKAVEHCFECRAKTMWRHVPFDPHCAKLALQGAGCVQGHSKWFFQRLCFTRTNPSAPFLLQRSICDTPLYRGCMRQRLLSDTNRTAYFQKHTEPRTQGTLAHSLGLCSPRAWLRELPPPPERLVPSGPSILSASSTYACFIPRPSPAWSILCSNLIILVTVLVTSCLYFLPIPRTIVSPARSRLCKRRPCNASASRAFTLNIVLEAAFVQKPLTCDRQ